MDKLHLLLESASYNNEDVKISPFLLKSIQNWEKHTEKIYKTKIDETVFQLFLNEKPIMQASHPNKGRII